MFSWFQINFLGKRKTAYDVKIELSVIGKEIEALMEKGSIDDFEEFIESKNKVKLYVFYLEFKIKIGIL